MEEEKKDIPSEANSESPPKSDGKQEQVHAPLNPAPESPIGMATEVAKRLNERRSELEALEQKIDKKIKDYNRFLDETAKEGRALAGQSTTESEEEKNKKEAMKLLEGTGLNPFA